MASNNEDNAFEEESLSPDNDAQVPVATQEPRFAWMGDAIDTEEVALADNWRLPQRSRAQAMAIGNYTATLAAYKTSRQPAYSSSRVKSKKANIFADEEETIASIVSPVFETHQRDALGTSGEQVAHLLSHDTGCAIFGEDVVVGLVGLEEDKSTGQTIPMSRIEKQSLIHGSRSDGAVARFISDSTRGIRRSLRKRKRKAEKLGPKVQHTGIKHCALNKIQLLEHKPFDKFPFMLLVPALKTRTILGWTPGTSYKIICLVGKDTSTDRATVDYRDRFIFCSDAEEREVKNAIRTLRKFVVGLAGALHRMEGFDDLVGLANRHDQLPANEHEALMATRSHLQAAGTMKLPQFSETKFRAVRIAQIQLVASIPDPYLMCVKAAANWCNFNGQKVLPGCRYEYDEEEDCCSICYASDVPQAPPQIDGKKEDVSDLESLADAERP